MTSRSEPLRSGALPDKVEQALLDTIHLQSVRIPVPVVIVAIVVCGMGFGRVPTAVLVAWAAAVVLMQVVRNVAIRRLVRPGDAPPGTRLARWTWLSALNGVVMASSSGFFPLFDDISRAVYSMIILGLTAGSVAITHGHRGLFVAYAGPLLGGLAIAWMAVPGETMPVWIRLSIALLVFLLGFILHGLARDAFAAFTENLDVNERLERALRAEQSANNAKTRFLAAASHDLRQPLHALSLLGAALAVRPLDPKSASIARTMNEAMSDLASELDALLDVSKLDAGVVRVEPEAIDLGAMLQRLRSGFAQQAAAKGLELRVERRAEATIRSDRALLERLLRNLLDNAIKYTERGEVVVSLDVRAGRCEIVVRDTGSGIPEAERERIFDEFYQIGNVARDRRKGLGLGLSIVRRLAELLEFELRLESRLGAGSSFRLTAPVTLEEPLPKDEAREAGPAVDLSGLHFLLLEDDLRVRSATRLVLEAQGARVGEAADAAEALAVVAQVRPDAVLADIRLQGGESGFEAVGRLREVHPGLPVLLISGETSPERLREAARLGAPLLVKPVDSVRLLRAIERVLQEPAR